MMKEARDIESALVTFLVTASGITLLGVGSAFWGLVAGLALFGARHVLGSVSVSAGPKQSRGPKARR